MSFFDNITDFFSKLPSLKFGVADFLDICLVAFIIYHGIKLIRETRAMQLVKGLLLLGLAYLVVYQFEMQSSAYIFRLVFQNIFIVLIILFQQEIRQVIERVGKSKFSALSALIKGNDDDLNSVTTEAVIEVAKAAQRMSAKHTGSLVVFEREIHLGDVIKTGTLVDAKVTHELVGNIFFPNSPLHDGAAIIRNGRLHCAGCVLPLSKNENISREIGTRHRAAIGISEMTDAIVVVTSEETGIISYAFKGELVRNVTEAQLREVLLNNLIDTAPEKLSADKDAFKKLFKGWKK